MYKVKLFTILAVIGLLALSLPLPSQAAQFHSGQVISFDQTDSLKDAYIAGSQVTINTPVTNDLVVAGNQVDIKNSVEKNLTAAAGTLNIDGQVGQTARVAGGTITITSNIGNDLIVLGGTVILSDKSKVTGDLVVAAGTITINGTVDGKVILKGGTATINGTIGSLANSRVDRLTVGPKAIINGNLSYQSANEASINSSAVIKGQVDFRKIADTQSEVFGGRNLSTINFFYNIAASLIFGFFLLFVLHKLSAQSIKLVKAKPWVTAAWGLGGIFLFPILAALMTVLSVWLGVAGFTLYFLCLVVGYFLGQLIIGWWFMQWWLGRTQESYSLDWRAVVVGVFASTILLLVPFIGWIIGGIAFILAIGTLGLQIWNLRIKS